MNADHSRAVVAQGPTSLAPISRLAERTLAERIERAQRALLAIRTLVVGPGGYATIRSAVDATRDGDTVLVQPGRYEEGVVVAGKTITIRGDGDRDAIVVGWDQGSAFTLVETRSTLIGLTIVGGQAGSRSNAAAALLVTGGEPQLDRLRVTQGEGVVFEARAVGAITRSQIDGDISGIFVHDGASPRIEGNEIWGSLSGIEVGDPESDPLVCANRIHDCPYGVVVYGGACPTIEANEIWGTVNAGICVRATGTSPLVRLNGIHAGERDGILVDDGAKPRIEENEIWATILGIDIGGARTDPLVRANRIHDGTGRGIQIASAASPRLEGNEIWANQGEGVYISGPRTSPSITGNTVRDGLDDGIYVSDRASPTIAGNTIIRNAREAIGVSDGAAPRIGQNSVDR